MLEPPSPEFIGHWGMCRDLGLPNVWNAPPKVKEEDSITDVKNAVLDFRVVNPSLSIPVIEQKSSHKLHSSRSTLVHSVELTLWSATIYKNGGLFPKPAYMEYTQWVFCKRCGKPIKHHRGYLTKRYGSLLLISSRNSQISPDWETSELGPLQRVVDGMQWRVDGYQLLLGMYLLPLDYGIGPIKFNAPKRQRIHKLGWNFVASHRCAICSLDAGQSWQLFNPTPVHLIRLWAKTNPESKLSISCV
ncbi:hypothetical protein Tco_0397792 [Tanacetum coccineum]